MFSSPFWLQEKQVRAWIHHLCVQKVLLGVQEKPGFCTQMASLNTGLRTMTRQTAAVFNAYTTRSQRCRDVCLSPTPPCFSSEVSSLYSEWRIGSRLQVLPVKSRIQHNPAAHGPALCTELQTGQLCCSFPQQVKGWAWRGPHLR